MEHQIDAISDAAISRRLAKEVARLGYSTADLEHRLGPIFHREIRAAIASEKALSAQTVAAIWLKTQSDVPYILTGSKPLVIEEETQEMRSVQAYMRLTAADRQSIDQLLGSLTRNVTEEISHLALPAPTKRGTMTAGLPEERLLKISEVEYQCGLKKTAIYERMKNKTFPLALKIGSSSRWPQSHIQGWIQLVGIVGLHEEYLRAYIARLR